jgi:uncharacterized protein (TIGR02391 family)
MIEAQEVLMPARRTQGPPSIQSRDFTLDDIDHGIRKLKRRIEEVRAIDPRTTRYDDPRVESAQRNIRADIIDIFGQNSPEYMAHSGHSLSNPEMGMGLDEYQYQDFFAEGLPKTVTMLEGLIRRLDEKREDLAGDKTARVRASFAGLDLHPRIAAVSADLYRGGHYRNAVLDASVALVNFVKEKSRRHDLDGSPLMTTVFSRNKPVLAFNDLKDKSEEDEQEGMMHLFMGAVLALRNPRAHAVAEDSPEHALECIGLLSFLAWQVARARRMP